MHRQLAAWAALSLIASAAGCCMCDAPYDYCGPTFLGRPGEECVTDARMNSAFTPYVPFVAVSGEVVEGGVVAPEAVEPGTPSGADESSPSDVPPQQSPANGLELDPRTPSVPAPAPRASEPTTTTQGPRGRPVSLRR
jgi:hypothetical protein